MDLEAQPQAQAQQQQQQQPPLQLAPFDPNAPPPAVSIPQRNRAVWLARWTCATLTFGGIAAFVVWFVVAWVGFTHPIAYVFLLGALQPALATLASLLATLWCIFLWPRLLPFMDGGRPYDIFMLVTGLSSYASLLAFAGMMISEMDGSSTVYHVLASGMYGSAASQFVLGFVVAVLFGGCLSLLAWRWHWRAFWRASTPLEWQAEEELERERREVAMRMKLG